MTEFRVTEAPEALTIDQDEALQPLPTVGGLPAGYGHVSTRSQNLDRQIRALTKAGCAKISPTSCPARTPTGPS